MFAKEIWASTAGERERERERESTESMERERERERELHINVCRRNDYLSVYSSYPSDLFGIKILDYEP